MPVTKMKEIAEEAINNERTRLDIGQPGADFMECVLNPRGSELGSVTTARIPDGCGQTTYLLRETGSYTWANGTNTSCFAQVVGASVAGTTSDQTFQVTYGASALDSSATMTVAVEAFADQYSLLGSLCHSGQTCRVVSSYLRVQSNADDDQTAVWEGYNCDILLRGAAATWNSNALIFGGVSAHDLQTYTAQKGITVRRRLPATYKNFNTPNSAIYTGVSGSGLRNLNGPMPLIRGSSLSNTNWRFDWGVVYEVIGSPTTIPVIAQRPDHEKELDQMVDAINDQPFTTEANTFKSFLKRAWNGLLKVGKAAWKNKEAIFKVGKTVASAM